MEEGRETLSCNGYKIQELKEEGKTQREIAEEIGIDRKAVSYQLGKNDKCQISPDPAPSYLEPDDDEAYSELLEPLKRT